MTLCIRIIWRTIEITEMVKQDSLLTPEDIEESPGNKEQMMIKMKEGRNVRSISSVNLLVRIILREIDP